MMPSPGTYALVLTSSSEGSIRIGKLGKLEVRPGYYVYVGSAFGPGGLKARVGCHRKIFTRLHWHIDYLRACTRLDEVWCTYDLVRREHQWAEVLARARGASVPLRGFGSSDCSCESHLYFFYSLPSGRSFYRQLRSKFEDHKEVCVIRET